MDEERKQFHDDLLESVRQMKAGKAARVTTVEVSAPWRANDADPDTRLASSQTSDGTNDRR